MIGRGTARPATTPQGRESPLPRAARGESGESRATIRRDGTDVREGGGSAVRCRGISRRLRRLSPSAAQDSARDHAAVDG